MAKLTDLTTLAKTSVASTDYLLVTNSNTKQSKKITVESLFPSVSTAGSGGETLYNSATLTNKNQLVFKGVKSADTSLLTVGTTSSNIELTVLEAGIDLNKCDNTTSLFMSGVDFTKTVTDKCPVVNGGTGLTTIAKGALLYASATDTIAATSAMSTNGQLLIGNATNGYPSVATLTAGSNVTITNGAGSITIAASLSSLAANLDTFDGSATTYNIDLNEGNGWISGSGLDEGLTVDADGKVFIGQNAPVSIFSETLTLKGSIRFTNDAAPTIKPSSSESSNVGQPLTIEAGSSEGAAAGNLILKAGTSSTGNNNGGDVTIYGGSEAGSGTAGSIKNYVYDGSGSAVQALTVTGSDANPDVTVDKGNLIITEAEKGIIHTGSGTVTQATNHSTGVTLNTTSGVITLAGVALSAAAEADFAVTNSTVQADSVILLTVQSSAAASATDNATLCAQLDEVNAGSFNVRLTNPGAGNVDTNAHKIHFLVINNS